MYFPFVLDIVWTKRFKHRGDKIQLYQFYHLSFGPPIFYVKEMGAEMTKLAIYQIFVVHGIHRIYFYFLSFECLGTTARKVYKKLLNVGPQN